MDLSTCHYLCGWVGQNWGVGAPQKEKYLLIIEANAKKAAWSWSKGQDHRVFCHSPVPGLHSEASGVIPSCPNQKARLHILHLSLPHPQVHSTTTMKFVYLLNTLWIIYLSLFPLLLPEVSDPSSLMDTSTAVSSLSSLLSILHPVTQ